jgi:hypothetical protein
MVNKPTHFTLTVAPSPTPVAASQNHQDGWKAFEGPCSCWFVKLVQASAVRAVKMMRGESRRMRRDWATSALSAVVSTHLDALKGVNRTKYDKTGSQGRSGRAATRSLEGQEHGRNGQDTADGRQHAHSNIWHTGLEVVHANVLEVEVSIESTQPSRKCDEELRQWRMYVHKELALDVLGRESTEAESTIRH